MIDESHYKVPGQEGASKGEGSSKGMVDERPIGQNNRRKGS